VAIARFRATKDGYKQVQKMGTKGTKNEMKGSGF